AVITSLFNVVGGITLGTGFRCPLDHAFDMVEAEQKRTGEQRNTCQGGLLIKRAAVRALSGTPTPIMWGVVACRSRSFPAGCRLEKGRKPVTAQGQDIEIVGIVGAGAMGRGIAQV